MKKEQWCSKLERPTTWIPETTVKTFRLKFSRCSQTDVASVACRSRSIYLFIYFYLIIYLFISRSFPTASPYRVYPPVTQKLARLWTQYSEAIMKVNRFFRYFSQFITIRALWLHGMWVFSVKKMGNLVFIVSFTSWSAQSNFQLIV